MTRPARLLYLGASAADFAILTARVRPAVATEIRTAVVGEIYPAGHEFAGEPVSVHELGDWTCDAVIYSPYIGTPQEQEAIFAAVLREF